MNEDELKAAFAAFMLDEPDTPSGRFAAALKLFPSEQETGKACAISFSWPNDPIVILELERLKQGGYKNKELPTKEDIIKEMWLLVKHEKSSPKDKKECALLIAQMMGHIAKADVDAGSQRMPTAPVYKVVNE